MDKASTALQFEQAAVLRDRIRALAHIQSHQSISLDSIAEADIFAAHAEGGQVCVQVFFLRAGQNLGNRAYFPSHARELDPPAVLTAFIGQFYEARPAPRLILTSHDIDEHELLEAALAITAGHKVEIRTPKRGDQKDALDQAVSNAREALARRMAERGTQRQLLEGVARVFNLDAPPERIEVYDNSHIQGHAPIGAMIVAGSEGFIKNSYRKFNIKSEEAAGDDFAMMREVLSRRFGRALKENPERDDESWPDLVLIDGGQGQLEAVRQVLIELGIEDIAVAGIAKGPDRDAPPRALLRAGQAALLARAARPGALFPATPARRGTPVRDRHAPHAPCRRHDALGARRGAGHRLGAQTGVAASFRQRPCSRRGNPGGHQVGPRHLRRPRPENP